MTPSEKKQLKQALLKYYFEKRPKWYAFHIEIREALGLPEGDKNLHERDPRNWIIDGMEPSAKKLSLYEEFIRKINTDFTFKENEVADYIDLGLTLARFAMQSPEAVEIKECAVTHLTMTVNCMWKITTFSIVRPMMATSSPSSISSK